MLQKKRKSEVKKCHREIGLCYMGAGNPKFISKVNTLAFIILNEEHPLQPWSAVSLVSAEICH